ncbi:MAG TPA: sigma-70 family RNA polymerase sigma factor [Solirubrobacteraceae bacterium]|nr:sigma-70 family RNA polymerase sigma factor [Solirubrobacteraceae bacterium]
MTGVEEFERRLRLEALFHAHAGAVRAYARRRVGRVAADDTVSEVFVVAWRRLDDVPDDPLPWLLGCARNVVAHQHRRARRDVALAGRLGAVAVAPDAPDGAPAQALSQLSDGALAQALSELSDGDRELLLLIAWEGLTGAQAARALGCSRNALAVRLHRARRRLAAALGRADRKLAAGAPDPAKEAV